MIMVALRWGGTVGRTIQSAQMKAKDGRILLMNEILQVLYLLQILTQTSKWILSGYESAQIVRLGKAIDGKGDSQSFGFRVICS